MTIYKCEKCGNVHRTEDDCADKMQLGIETGRRIGGSRESIGEHQRPKPSELPPILDACCGRRMFWFNKHDPRAVYVDKRQESYLHKQKARRDHWIVIDPDEVADFTNLPFPNNSFYCVIFDPPHIVAENITGSMHKYYGVLNGDWKEMLRRGFSECFRVLKPLGTLVFKWNEVSIQLSEILALTPEKPLIGNRKPATSKTHWILFMKPENEPCQECNGVGFLQAEHTMTVHRISDGAPVEVDGLPIRCAKCGGSGMVCKSNASGQPRLAQGDTQ
mgnify:CR=1 FL=1